MEHPGSLQTMLMVALAAVVQDDLTCAGGGISISRDLLGLWPTLAGCFLGTLAGDLAWFFLGRYVGRRGLRWRFVQAVVDGPRLDKAEQWFARWGAGAILISRFLPGSRTAVQVASGVLHLPVVRAVALFAVAAALYTAVVVGAFVAFDRAILDRLFHTQRYLLPILAAGACAAWLALRIWRRTTRKVLPYDDSAASDQSRAQVAVSSANSLPADAAR